MISQDPRIDPNTANVIDHDLHQPYARRSINTIVGFVALLLCLGGFVGWYFFGSAPQEVQYQQTNSELGVTGSQQTLKTQGNEYARGSGRSKVYNFFYHMFGGIEDGLEESPHNLENVDHLDKFNIDSDELFDGNASPALTLNQALRGEATKASQTVVVNDGYRHSVFDVIGSDVQGKEGDNVGAVFDILVHKETGEALAIIINDDESRYDRELKALSFKRITKQQADGDVLITITEDKTEEKPNFSYSAIDNSDYVSLRHLQDGQLLDFEGKVAGQVDAVIYENAEAQNIYFTLRPVLSVGSVDKFQLPYEEINIIESADGYDIKLTKEQTLALAELLFKK